MGGWEVSVSQSLALFLQTLVKKTLAPILLIFVGGAAAVSRLLPRAWWVFDVLNNFHPHYFLVLTAVFILFLRAKRRWLAGLTAVFALIPLTLLLPHYLPKISNLQSLISSSQPLRLFMSNVYSFRPNLNSVLDLADESDADIIVLLEMIPLHYNEVQALRQTHPYFFHEPRITGQAIFSRVPFRSVKLQPFAGERIDVVVAVDGERPFILIATHLKPTVSAIKAAQRNAHFVDMARYVNQLDEPVVVAGDFNSSPWSVYFQEFVWETGLQDGRLGNGILPTWPAPRFALNQFPHLAPALTPLDHVLYSNHILLHTFERARYVGSDHYPLLVEFSLP